MATKRIIAADLFCGAGGFSTGLTRAVERLGRRLDLTAVNHWDRAIETHSKNHPKAAHFCQSLADLDPKKAIPGGKLDLLLASPECTHHSVARGGKPVNDQSRATAYCVHRWCAALDVRRVLIENVPEFQTWGPLGQNGKPLASGKGKLFDAYIQTFKAMGYRVEWRVLNAADFGAATSRRRLFIQCVKGRTPLKWPAPTHTRDPKPGLFETLPRWRGAREVIDWSHRGTSIFGRSKPLSENTLKRIEAGLKKFGGANAEPFLLLLRGTDPGQLAGSAKSLDLPAPPITCSGAHLGLVEPFLTKLNFTKSRDHDERYSRSVDAPLPTITSQGNRFGIVEPFLIPTNYGEREGQSPRCHDINRPCPTVTAGGVTHALVEPFILPHRQFDGMQVDDIDNPLRTVTATNGGCNALVQPFTVPYYSNGSEADGVGDPLRTVTTKDRFGLCEPVAGRRRDILFRMLQPDELKQAMGFGKGYVITGNRGEQVKQIGNAVSAEQAEALEYEMLSEAA
jgi:DNA (cytosine-5)-methyltransferase 1